MKQHQHIKIFDTTLRDGQQCPGAGMSFKDNLRYFELVSLAGMDIVEVGFPAAGRLDYEIVNTIALQYASLKDCPIIAALCQTREEQVDTTIEALHPAAGFGKARLHIYLPVDPELMASSLGDRAEKKSELIQDVYRFVKKASSAGLEVEFSPEGYSRMGKNFDFVTDLIVASIEAGASVINCPDTIGGAYRFQGEEYFVEKMKRHAEIMAKRFPNKDITWSTHCHNDFGLAVENSIAAVFNGPARQIEGCINGVGERAGNASIEQCIMIIKHFAKSVNADAPVSTKIKTEKLKAVSDFIAEHMLPRQPHFPIVGDSAAKHSSGGHTNAVLKNPLAYQPFDPSEVGTEITFIFGPMSGGNHAKSIIEKAGFICAESEKAAIAQFLKELYKERRKGITDQEVVKGYFEYRKPIRVDSIDYAKSTNKSSVQLTGRFFSEQGEINENHQGKDSALAALKKAVDRHMSGLSVQSHRATSDREGIDAQSLSTIIIADQAGNTYSGTGLDQDIEISAMKALIDAVNNAFVEKNYKK